MSAKPTLTVRPPKNIDDFVHGAAANSQRSPVKESPVVATAEVIKLEPSALEPSAAEAPVPSHSTPPSSPRASRTKIRGLVRRSDGVERGRLTVYISVPAAAKLRRFCFENGLELTDVAGAALEEAIERMPS